MKDSVCSCNTVTAALADNFTAEIMDGQEENGTENIYVEGSSDPVEYFSSVSSVVTLISGHVPQNAEEAVVSDGIAERNGLGIGDTIAVLSPYTKERYTFKNQWYLQYERGSLQWKCGI